VARSDVPAALRHSCQGRWLTQNEIACAQLCGLGHCRMRGFVTVQTAEEFQKWMEEKLKEQSAPDLFR